MAKSFLTPINLNKNELQNAAVQNLGTAPSSPVKGQMYFNSTGGDNTLYWFDGSSWVAAKAPATSGIDQATADARYLQLSGASPMTGNITMPASSSVFFGSAGASGTLSGAAGLVTLDLAGAGGTTRLRTNGTTRLSVSDSTVIVGTGVDMFLDHDPTSGLHAATKQYVDALTAGLSWSDAVRAATTANITLSGTQTIDGVAVVANDRVLVKNQTTTNQNGIYLCAAGAWTRATDADSEGDLLNLAVWVSEGTTLADTGWVMTTNAPITVGTTALAFSQFASASGAVPPTRTINTTAPLTGGGDLSTDRTLAISNFTTTSAGAVPNPVSSSGRFLKDDGTWASALPASGTVTPAMLSNADFGDFTVAAGVATIDAGVVTLAKMANLAQDQVIGRVTASTGVPETFTVTAAARTVLDDTTTAAMLTTLGAQPVDADLTTIAGLTATTNNFMVAQSSAWASVTPTVATSLLNAATTTLKGLVPAPGTATGKFLKDDLTWATAGAVNKFTQATVGGATSQVITHNLNSQAVVVSVYRTLTPWEEIECDVEHTSVNTITLRFAVAPATNEYSVAVIG